jgi:hypothetical protein
MYKLKVVTAICLALILSSCVQTIPKDALQLSPESLALKQLQTRGFDTRVEKKIIISGASVLQDLGYSIDESETKLGVVVGSKDKSAVNGGQIAASILVAALGGGVMPTDKQQKIRVSLVTHKNNNKTFMRATFQRVVWDTQGNVTRSESLEDPALYQEFFEKLSKSVFLEAHEI